MKDKFEEDDKLFGGLYYQIGKHHTGNVSEYLDNINKNLDEVEYPDELNLWFNEFLTDHERKKRTLKRKKWLNTFSRRIAVFIILFVIVITMTTLSVEAFRVKVFNIVTDIREKYSKIEFKERDTIKQGQYSITWDLYLYPEYLPDGYYVTDAQKIGDIKIIHFSDEKGKNLEFSQSPINSSLQVDTENVQTKNVVINDSEGMLIEKNGVHIIIWTKGESALYMIGEISEEEIFKIAESVVMKKK
ncbi:DUF4367 domain-containing protein [Oxobacter pfennigii]|nr:DUF4367 domain-containing protein [Oxobacter pfennigii]